ncbi:hypothetical protein OH76DRAFT_1484619 [Lentinus brumalis]|uniref:Uncharacterized protein n=1 Tax=Lentinus brumalis TaxID=2498619 RepID=A0A371D4P2_9APHY|nr:hypothetical protein OH76DRAFT_1484619 [Polyporus brumalis]
MAPPNTEHLQTGNAANMQTGEARAVGNDKAGIVWEAREGPEPMLGKAGRAGMGSGRQNAGGADGVGMMQPWAGNVFWPMQFPPYGVPGAAGHGFQTGVFGGSSASQGGGGFLDELARPPFHNMSNGSNSSPMGPIHPIAESAPSAGGVRQSAATEAAPPSMPVRANTMSTEVTSAPVQLVMTQEQFNEAVSARVRAELAKNDYTLDKRLKRIKVRPEVRHAVRKCALRLMGCSKKVPSTHSRLKPYYPLPAPLAPGAEKRKDRDGNDLWNPDWDSPVDQGVNADFIEAVVGVVLQTGVVTYRLKSRWLAEPALIKHAAQAHFRHLRRQFNYRKDGNGIRHLLAKNSKDHRQARRSRKANRRRKVIPPFRKAFGRGETEGIEQLIQTPLMSSEASTDGEADPAERERMREEQGAGRKALETHTMMLRADQLNRLYATLDAFARVQEAEEDGRSSGPSSSSSDESDSDSSETSSGPESVSTRLLNTDDNIDLPELERAAYRAQVAAKIRTVQAGDSQFRYDRFRGPRANYRTSLRRTKKRLVVYKECLNVKWVSQSTKNQRVYDKAEAAPAWMTIFQLQVPEEFFLNEDRGYLADSEKGFDELE